MRIVHVYKDYFPPSYGGMEQIIARIAQQQVRDGHDVTVLVSAPGSRRTVRETLDGVRVIRCAEMGRITSAPLSPTMPVELARLHADIVHLHFPNPTGEISWLLARPRGALVVSYHSDIVRQRLVLPLYAPVVRRLFAHAALLLPTSDAYIARSDFLRPNAHKCHVVPLGIDLERFENVRERYAGGAAALRQRYGDGPLTLFVGKLRYYKGLHVLLDAWTQAPGTLVIIGEGRERERLRAQHAALGLGDRVVFAGEVGDDELFAHFAAADIGVLPSHLPSEAYGLAMVEMLAAGLPVVCTELGTGTTFVNKHEVTGLVVPPSDPLALAAAIARLAGDPALRARLGAGGIERARTVLSREAMMRELYHAYDRALAAH